MPVSAGIILKVSIFNMQILHKHITQSGGLSIVWEDHGRRHVFGMTLLEVRKFLYKEGIISNRIDNMILAKRRSVFKGTALYWIDYKQFMSVKIQSSRFCEQILSTNTLLK